MTRDPNALYARAREGAHGAVLHVRFEGVSRDIELEVLNLNRNSTDKAVRMAVASFLDKSVEQLDSMVVERHSNGNLTLRPEAVFG